MSPRGAGRPPRVAIAGCGPKGMYCLERLLDHAGRAGRPIEVHVYEPTGQPGAGAVYRAGQPDYLRMNFADSLIDAWPEGRALVPPSRRPSLGEWLGERGVTEDGYSPRALVGEYLRECFREVVAAAPANARIDLHGCAVDSLDLPDGGSGWRVLSADGALEVDEVMLALGHRDGTEGPLADRLGLGAVEPGEPVAVRGMALTFIDVALELTEGRGGRFLADPAAPGGLRYERSGEEPGPINARSRSGRPMLVKPGPGVGAGTDPGAAGPATGPSRAAILAAGRERLLGLADEGFAMGLTGLLAGTAAQLLGAAPGHDRSGGNGDAAAIAAELRARLARGSGTGGVGADGKSPSGTRPARARDELGRSCAAASGHAAPDSLAALGESWRGLHPALVERAGHGRLPAAEWPSLAELAREMERIAFGPPPVNGAKLLALIDAGVVRLGAPHARPAEDDGARRIDAVIAAPGIAEPRDDLAGRLLDRGWLRRAPGGRRGIEVGADAACVGADGRPVPGLAAVGRLTEDWVIGNDTLSRRLHDHPERWAQRAVAG